MIPGQFVEFVKKSHQSHFFLPFTSRESVTLIKRHGPPVRQRERGPTGGSAGRALVAILGSPDSLIWSARSSSASCRTLVIPGGRAKFLDSPRQSVQRQKARTDRVACAMSANRCE